MNEIVNKFLLTAAKFMLELHLKQPGFTYSACGTSTKSWEELKNSEKKVTSLILLMMLGILIVNT